MDVRSLNALVVQQNMTILEQERQIAELQEEVSLLKNLLSK
jgi:hypothetical protein